MEDPNLEPQPIHMSDADDDREDQEKQQRLSRNSNVPVPPTLQPHSLNPNVRHPQERLAPQRMVWKRKLFSCKRAKTPNTKLNKEKNGQSVSTRSTKTVGGGGMERQETYLYI